MPLRTRHVKEYWNVLDEDPIIEGAWIVVRYMNVFDNSIYKYENYHDSLRTLRLELAYFRYKIIIPLCDGPK